MNKIAEARHSIKVALDILAKKKKKKKPKSKAHTKAKEIADALRRDNPDMSDAAAYKISWESVCSYTNKGHKGCTPKGKSKRKSPKKDRVD